MLHSKKFIANTIKKFIGVKLKPLHRPVYRNPYPEWVDRLVPLPIGFKTPDFATFSGDDGKLTRNI